VVAEAAGEISRKVEKVGGRLKLFKLTSKQVEDTC